MKVAGKAISGPNVVVLVFPREGGEDIVFKARAVLEMDDYDKLYPSPEPPTVTKKDLTQFKDVNDKNYLVKLGKYNEQRFTYMILKSLEATPGLEWDTVKMDDPTTWENYTEDLKNAGFSQSERNQLMMIVFEANSLNEQKLKEAKDRFSLSQSLAAQASLSQKVEASTTESGEPANASV